MKKILQLLILISAFFNLHLKSQNIGINGTGGNAHPSALLDIDAVATPSLGLLIPRIALQAINLAAPVTSPATSLLVFNTASASSGTNAVSPGYYYWDGAKWARFNTGATASAGWDLLGNIGTTAGTNFIGTTDAVDWVIKTNNTEKMRVLSTGNVGIGTATPGFKLHVPSGYIGTDYINTTDNAVTAGVTGVMVKQGDNFYRTANAAAINTFLGITAPTGDNLGNHTATTVLNMNGNYIDNAQGSSRFAQSNNTTTDYANAPIQIREAQYAGVIGAKAPRISFHWGGVIASQIGLESTGRIAILNNPGTGYENIIGQEIYSNAWFRNVNSGTGLYNEVNATGIFSPSAGVMAIYNNGSLGIGTTAPAAKLEVTQGTAGNSGIRMTNFPNSPVLATNASGDIITATANTTNGAFWGLTGNAGTIDGTNFIGTTDNIPFSIKVNNQNAGRIDNTSNNAFFGYQACNFNINGTYNTAIGQQALYNNTSGGVNTAVGQSALYKNTLGSNNTAVGQAALYNNISGFNNTSIGYAAGPAFGFSGLMNTTAIGNVAQVNASNKVRIGDVSVTVIEGQVAYSFPSDGRFKYNIKEEVKGLDFISKLRPVIYQFDTKKFDEFLMKNMPDSIRRERNKGIDYSESSAIMHTGFIAQEVELAAKESGFIFDGVSAPKDENGNYGVAYSQFVVPLVKSVQELSLLVNELKKQNELQQQEIELLKKR